MRSLTAFCLAPINHQLNSFELVSPLLKSLSIILNNHQNTRAGVDKDAVHQINDPQLLQDTKIQIFLIEFIAAIRTIAAFHRFIRKPLMLFIFYKLSCVSVCFMKSPMIPEKVSSKLLLFLLLSCAPVSCDSSNCTANCT